MTTSTTSNAIAISPARINWRDGVPESSDFGDVYFSRDNGLEETRHVFLHHNRLRERFEAVRSGGHFVIAESGFGTGLNFLAAWQDWRDSRPPEDSVLHFVSVERFPLTPADLKQAHDLWPELAEFAIELQEHYPELVAGTHRLVLDGGRVRLTLFLGDALDGWKDLEFTADAWFLDGFAPSLNPELWVDEIVTAIQQHSRPGTTVATFTAVGRVRRALAAAGFVMSKVPGYGRKREMLAGTYQPDAECPGQGSQGVRRSTIIVGAGIAGSLLARNLAERGEAVTVIDSAEAPGSGASGNRQGALYVKLGVDYSPQTKLALSALLFSQRFYHRFEGVAWFPSGVLQLAYNEAECHRQGKFLANNSYPVSIVRPVSAAEASQLSGAPIATGGLWFPRSGWLRPARLCELLLDHPNISTRLGIEVNAYQHDSDRWQLTDSDGEQHSGCNLVLCAGHRIGELLPKDQYRFKPIRGQVTLLPIADIHAPDCVVCGNRYLNPADNGVSVTGATFDLKSTDAELSPDSQLENLKALAAMLPGIFKKPVDAPRPLDGKVGFRCTTHDYQPAAGTLPPARQGAATPYILTGLGSKGLSYAPLLAEYLADCITGQPQALPTSLAYRLRPGRCIANRQN